MIEENKSKWSNFGNWTECTESCGGCGIRWRNRECLKKKDECNCIGWISIIDDLFN
uniref:Candidate secreted effector n=1 Tax=Meloidogyne incognita TaxID=6306 RepID=A0A914NNB7_MELIC